ncbi:MAG: restriction endonuclease [Acidobacteria bacterium]|nr:restriction endonuclease [Acidobacteriota bacterium]
MRPVLEALQDGSEKTAIRLRAEIAAALGLSQEDLSERLASDRQSVFANRVGWAQTYLSKACAIERVKRGVFRITARGRDLLRQSDQRITVGTLEQFPEFLKFYERGSSSSESGPSLTEPTVQIEPSKETPQERMQSGFDELQQALQSDLLEAVRGVTPAHFEKIVLDLLVAMGYGGSLENAGEVVGQSGDDGIDGIIKEDKLGLDIVYIQAKRWKDSVGRPVVQAFAGSLEGQRARKGVLLTTSTFSKDAVEYVKRIEKKIVLIDGERLAKLMIEHNVGVTVTQKYELKKIDQDFFEDE